MKYTFRSTGENPPKEPNIFTSTVKEGVFFLVIDFVERIELCASGNDDGEESLYFERTEGGGVLEVAFQVSQPHEIHGGVTKKTYRGTAYRWDVMSNLLS